MNEITKDNLVLTSKFQISSADTDMEARIRLGSIANLLIQSAINSADSLGFGYKGMLEQKLFWVLSRLTIEIYRPMIWDHLIKLWRNNKNIIFVIYTYNRLCYQITNILTV